MDYMIKMLYMCYLSNDSWTRTCAARKLAREKEGIDFFKKYSTDKDSVLKFMKKLDKALSRRKK